MSDSPQKNPSPRKTPSPQKITVPELGGVLSALILIEEGINSPGISADEAMARLRATAEELSKTNA